MKQFLFIILAGLFLFGLLNCESPGCMTGDINCHIAFYHNTGSQINDTIIDSTIVYPLLFPEEKLVSIFQKEKGFSDILDNTRDTTSFVLFYDSLVYDTIHLVYDRELNMISHDCGFAHYFRLKEVIHTNNKMDSVWISKPLVDYSNEENIKLYY